MSKPRISRFPPILALYLAALTAMGLLVSSRIHAPQGAAASAKVVTASLQ